MTASAKDWPQFPATAKGHCELMAHAHAELHSGCASVEAFVLQFGEEFSGQHLPEDMDAMTPQMCFLNCFEIAKDNCGLTYCEGFILRDTLPLVIHHAWLVNDDSQVVEPTVTDEIEGLTYFGIKLPFESVADIVDATGSYSVLGKFVGHRVIEDVCIQKGGLPLDAQRNQG